MHRTPTRASGIVHHPPMDELDQRMQVFQRRLGEDPVPKVEDMARPPASPAQHVLGAPPDQGGRPEEDGWVEIPLHTPVEADAAPTDVEGDAPVESDHVWTGGRDR